MRHEFNNSSEPRLANNKYYIYFNFFPEDVLTRQGIHDCLTTDVIVEKNSKVF